jgi:hypothetical protein
MKFRAGDKARRINCDYTVVNPPIYVGDVFDVEEVTPNGHIKLKGVTIQSSDEQHAFDTRNFERIVKFKIGDKVCYTGEPNTYTKPNLKNGAIARVTTVITYRNMDDDIQLEGYTLPSGDPFNFDSLDFELVENELDTDPYELDTDPRNFVTPPTPTVLKPNHYAIEVKGVKFDVIDLIQALDIGFELGNALKYIIRAGKKQDNPTAQDLSKAMECIRRRVDFMEKK